MRDKINLEPIVSITTLISNWDILFKVFYILMDSYLDASI